MNRHSFLALSAALAAGSLPSPVVSASLEDELAWAGVPGASLATVTRHEVQTQQLGYRDVARKLPMVDGTIFEAASLSKPVFAFAVMELVEGRRFELDRPLDAYLPSPYPIDDPRGNAITARQVLTHTSGLPNWREQAGEPLRLQFAPGTRYLYSGEGFYFLQTVVEQITNSSMTQFMRSALDRLGMHNSSYLWQTAYDHTSALPYDLDGKPLPHDSEALGTQLRALAKATGEPLANWKSATVLEALPHLHPPRAALPWNAMPNAAWSLFTTTVDYAAFVRALLDRPDAEMLKPAVRVGSYVWRGLGISLQQSGDSVAFFHTGANPGFKSVMFGDLKANRGMVSFTNGDGGFPFNMHALEHALGPQPAITYLEQP